MPAPIPTRHRCDVWEPLEHIDPDGSVDTPTYRLSQSDLPANFQSRGRAKRLFSGLDVTQAGVRLYLYGTLLQPSDRALFVNAAEGDVYRSDGPAEWYEAYPFTAGHFEIDLTLEKTPPDEVAALYPE